MNLGKIEIKAGAKKVWLRLKKLPRLLVTHALVGFFVGLLIEGFVGFHLYQRFCFPELGSRPSPSFVIEREKFESAASKIGEEEKEQGKIGEKEYFSLFTSEKSEVD